MAFWGARYLKGALGSTARIFETDLDSQFALKEGRYDLTFFLGLLYHLKNPFYALERMAKHSRYMFISTRIARHFRAGTQDVSSIPAAYLLAPDESNNDRTNYWVFTKAGFERLVDRTGWNLVASHVIGSPNSNPQDNRLDERMFALLEAR
jgi:tRNA (mo5U34)-methyltransferase